MNYKNKTKILGIPVPASGDIISSDSEMRKYTIIENMLIAGTQGVADVVFDDGYYFVETTGDFATVRLHSTGVFPSAHGIIGHAYFNAPSRLSWDNMKKGRRYYLYLRATSQTFVDSSAVKTVISSREIPKEAVLMAIFDWTEEEYKLETEPDGKVYSGDIARHAKDFINPHGRELHQDKLVVKELVVLEKSEGLDSRKISCFGGKTNGRDGIVFSVTFPVDFVEVHKTEIGTLGEVRIGYYGEDANVDTEKEFIVYNDGQKELSIKLKVTGK